MTTMAAKISEVSYIKNGRVSEGKMKAYPETINMKFSLGLQPILSIIQPVTIDAMLNNNGPF